MTESESRYWLNQPEEAIRVEMERRLTVRGWIVAVIILLLTVAVHAQQPLPPSNVRLVDQPPTPAISAASCSEPDVQAAITVASSGSAVVIPNGACAWPNGITIRGKSIQLRGQSETGVQITSTAAFAITVTEDASLHTQISNLTALTGGSGWFIRILPYSAPTNTGKAVLIHHLTVYDRLGILNESNRGVIWSCTGDGRASTNGGLLVPNYTFLKVANSFTQSWKTPSTFGADDTTGENNIYLEDCRFTWVNAAVTDLDDDSRAVIRFNVFDHSSAGTHGADTSNVGQRHFELYNNTFIFNPSLQPYPPNVPYLFFMRGGTGVIADNIGFADMFSSAWGSKAALVLTVMNLRRNGGPNACWGSTTSGIQYPAPRQVGLGYVTGTGKDGAGRSSDAVAYVGDQEPLYIWGNPGFTAPALQDFIPIQCGTTADTVLDYLQPGRNFIVGTPKPGYVKKAYPHPLRVGLQ